MRLRITFSKTGALRYIGHLDLHTIWERAARRAGLPLSYSNGFHPQPKISLAAALPLGFSSRGEVLDLRLNEELELAQIPGRLQAAMPEGIGILNVERVDDSLPALQTQVLSAEYEVRLTEAAEPSGLKRRADEVLASPALPRERRGKSYDLRPLIEVLGVESTGGPSGVMIRMRLACREGATGRPEEVLEVLGVSPEMAQVERTRLIFREYPVQ